MANRRDCALLRDRRCACGLRVRTWREDKCRTRHALTGLILFIYGYGSGAYVAFTEDDLYGWLYLMFPPYAAYYFVSRWDEMMSRFVMLIVGLALLAGGGRLLESARWAEASDKEAVAAPQ